MVSITKPIRKKASETDILMLLIIEVEQLKPLLKFFYNWVS